MPKLDSDIVHDAYGNILEKLWANLYEAYATEADSNPAAEKKFATMVKIARQARDKAIKIVSTP